MAIILEQQQQATAAKAEEKEIKAEAKAKARARTSSVASARSLAIHHRSATTTTTPTMFSRHYLLLINNMTSAARIWMHQFLTFLETSFLSSTGLDSSHQECHSQLHLHMLQVSQHHLQGMSVLLVQWSTTSAT